MRTKRVWAFLVVMPAVLGGGLVSCSKKTEGKVYFTNLEDGANVESPFKVIMKAENLIVEPATMGVREGHAHMHIIIDRPLAGPGAPMLKDADHIHYGLGETQDVLDLPVGQHSLILQFAKGDHVPYDPPIYQQITINVTARNPPLVDTTAAGTAKDSAARGADSLRTDTASSSRYREAQESTQVKP